MRQPKPELFTCPTCNDEVEIWSDEFSNRCPSCGTVVVKDGPMSCLEWCEMARECVGEKAFESFNKVRANSIKERLLKTTAALSGGNRTRSRLAERTLHYAEIITQEERAEPHIVFAGAVLSVLYEGKPERAREELLRLGFQLDDAEEVCSMIAHRHEAQTQHVISYAIVHDARMLAEEELSVVDRPSVNPSAADPGATNQPPHTYLTGTGRKLGG